MTTTKQPALKPILFAINLADNVTVRTIILGRVMEAFVNALSAPQTRTIFLTYGGNSVAYTIHAGRVVGLEKMLATSIVADWWRRAGSRDERYLVGIRKQ